MLSTQLMKKNGRFPGGDTGHLIAMLLMMVVWSVDSFWLNWTTFASEVISAPVCLTIAIPIWILAGILFKTSQITTTDSRNPDGLIRTGLFKSIRQPVFWAMMLGCLGLVLTSLSLAALSVWLLIIYFNDWQICWYILPEQYQR